MSAGNYALIFCANFAEPWLDLPAERHEPAALRGGFTERSTPTCDRRHDAVEGDNLVAAPGVVPTPLEHHRHVRSKSGGPFRRGRLLTGALVHAPSIARSAGEADVPGPAHSDPPPNSRAWTNVTGTSPLTISTQRHGAFFSF